MKDTAQTALTLAKRTQARAILFVLLAGSLWGCIGLFSRTLSALGVGPESIVILRNAGPVWSWRCCFWSMTGASSASSCGISPFSWGRAS